MYTYRFFSLVSLKSITVATFHLSRSFNSLLLSRLFQLHRITRRNFSHDSSLSFRDSRRMQRVTFVEIHQDGRGCSRLRLQTGWKIANLALFWSKARTFRTFCSPIFHRVTFSFVSCGVDLQLKRKQTNRKNWRVGIHGNCIFIRRLSIWRRTEKSMQRESWKGKKKYVRTWKYVKTKEYIYVN